MSKTPKTYPFSFSSSLSFFTKKKICRKEPGLPGPRPLLLSALACSSLLSPPYRRCRHHREKSTSSTFPPCALHPSSISTSDPLPSNPRVPLRRHPLFSSDLLPFLPQNSLNFFCSEPQTPPKFLRQTSPFPAASSHRRVELGPGMESRASQLPPRRLA